jgi:hypothetical protein
VVPVAPTTLKYPVDMLVYSQVPTRSPGKISALGAVFINRIRAALKRVKVITPLVYLSHGGAIIIPHVVNLVPSISGSDPPLRHCTALDVSGLGVELNGWFNMALVIAGELMDHQYLLAGLVPQVLGGNRLLQTNRVIVWGAPDAVTSVYISPLAARRAVTAACDELTGANMYNTLTLITLVVLSGPADTQAWAAIAPSVREGYLKGNQVKIA